MQVNFKFLKFIVDQVFKLLAAFNTVTALLEQYELVFSAKACIKVAAISVKIGEAIVFLVDPTIK